MDKKRSFCFEFRTINHAIKKNLDRERLPEFKEITPLHAWAIGYLYDRRDGDVFQKDLESEFKIRRSTASQLFSLMEKNGLIERQPVDYDARLKKITLTEKAIRIHDAITENLSKVEEKISDCLTESETDTFFCLLDKIKQNLQ